MAYSEHDVVQSLSQQLHVLEAGLTLVGTESVLRNQRGAGGRIDLHARDAYGHRVVIEVKRDDTPAREAVHELFKYYALLAREHGVPREEIRCILVSTSWRELLVPFSELHAVAPFPLDGYTIDVDSSGKILAATPVEPLLIEGEPVKLDFQPNLLFWKTAAAREAALTQLVGRAKDLAVDALFIGLDVKRVTDVQFAWAHAVYFAMAEPTQAMATFLETVLITPSIDDGIELTVMERASLDVMDAVKPAADDWELTTPAGFGAMSRYWTVGRVLRTGKRLSEAAHSFTDDELVSMAKGIRGEGPNFFSRRVHSRFPASWHTMRSEIRARCGDSDWGRIAEAVLDQTDVGTAEAEVTIFDPRNIVMFLASRHAEEPYFVLELTNRGATRKFIGMIEWDGTPPPIVSSIPNLVGAAIGSLDAAQESHLFALFGLRRSLFEVSGSGTALLRKRGALSGRQVTFDAEHSPLMSLGSLKATSQELPEAIKRAAGIVIIGE